MSQKDELQELYNLFHDGPCGQFYQQWEQCVEVVRREGDDENIDQRCALSHPAKQFALCMKTYPKQYQHLVAQGTPDNLVTEGIQNIFAVMYAQCISNGKCKQLDSQ
mmetsp:Transcript_24997/g.47274  ORF Transcript_24997/g.47274 Transcript_24997/m.47274 type:complete len:107 (+) Transcript_24997:113-433(+)